MEPTDTPSRTTSTVPRMWLKRARSKRRLGPMPQWAIMRTVQRHYARGCSFEYRAFQPLIPSRLRDSDRRESTVSFPSVESPPESPIVPSSETRRRRRSAEDVVEGIAYSIELASLRNIVDSGIFDDGDQSSAADCDEDDDECEEEGGVDDWILSLMNEVESDSDPPPPWVLGEDGQVNPELQMLIDELHAIGYSGESSEESGLLSSESFERLRFPHPPLEQGKEMSSEERERLTAEGWIFN